MQDTKRTQITGQAVSVPGGDIDTDRIIPARFLKCVTFDDLGAYAFEDDRKQLKAAGKQHPFDDPQYAEATVLFVNKNFGCGSSREHAPQSLKRWNQGIQTVVGESFAEIFFGNCVALGIPCLTVSESDIAILMGAVAQDPSRQFTVDLDALKLVSADITVPCHMEDGPRGQLINGRWDSTAELLAGKAAVDATMQRLPYLRWNA